MRVVFGKHSELERVARNIRGVTVLPFSRESKLFSQYGVMLSIPSSSEDQKILGTYLSGELAKLAPSLLSIVLPDSFPVGPWALMGKIGNDRRYMVANKGLRSSVDDFILGAEIAKELPDAMAAAIKPVHLRMMYENRYRNYESFLVSTPMGKILPRELALFEAMAFNPMLLPPLLDEKQNEWMDLASDPLSPGSEAYFEFLASQFGHYDFLSRLEFSAVDFVKLLRDEYPDLGWRLLGRIDRVAKGIDEVFAQLKAQNNVYKLFWYDTPIARIANVTSRVFFPEVDTYLTRLISRHNGYGVIHPLFDNLLTERTPNLVRDIRAEADSASEDGRIVAANLGHIRLINLTKANEYHLNFSEAKLTTSIAELDANDDGILLSGIVTDISSVESQMADRRVMANDVEVPAIRGVNISGQQLKFGGTLKKIDGQAYVVPSQDGEEFTHIIKPPASHTGGEMFPIAEWLGVRAAKAAGLTVAECALFCCADYTDNAKSLMKGTFSSGLDDAFGVFTSETIPNISDAYVQQLKSGMQVFFVSERFDISHSSDAGMVKKIGLDLCQIDGRDIINDNHSKYSATLEDVVDIVKSQFNQLGDWESQKQVLFGQLAASWLMMDSDLHLKNLSLLYRQELDAVGDVVGEQLTMAPAYDRVIIAGLGANYARQMALPFVGHKPETLDNWVEFAEKEFGIKQTESRQLLTDMNHAILDSVYKDICTLVSCSHFMSDVYRYSLLTDYCRNAYCQLVEHAIECGFGRDLEHIEEHYNRAVAISNGGAFSDVQRSKEASEYNKISLSSLFEV